MLSNNIQASQLAKLGVIVIIGVSLGFAIFSLIGSNDQDSNNELREHSEHILEGGSPARMRMVGGLGNTREKDDIVTEVVDKIKPEFEAVSGKKFESIEVLSYKTQTVAGKNYFVKARAKEVDGPSMIVHLRIYQNLGNNLELTAHQLDRKEEDEVVWFQ